MPKQSQQILRYLTIVVIFIAASAFGYRTYQIQKEKSDFAQAEQAIDSLAQQIEQTIGKPDETKKAQSCDRANIKNSEGPLVCSTSRYAIYKNKTYSEANDLMSKIKTFSSANIRKGSAASEGDKFIDNMRFEQVFYQDIEIGGVLSCVASYSFPSKDRNFENISAESFEYGIGCSSPTIKQLYPLHD